LRLFTFIVCFFYISRFYFPFHFSKEENVNREDETAELLSLRRELRSFHHEVLSLSCFMETVSSLPSSCLFLHRQVILRFRFLDFVQRFLNLDFVQFLILIRVSLHTVCLNVIPIRSILFNFQFALGFSVFNLFECDTNLK
jgi:hypothetical protein